MKSFCRQTKTLGKEVHAMNYTKPQLLVVGSATEVIQGKASGIEVDPPTNHTKASYYDLDE